MVKEKKGINLIILILIIIAVIVIGAFIIASIVNKNGKELSNNSSKLSSKNEKIVGRWVYVDEQGYKFIDLYSDGTGWTNYYMSKDYDGVTIKWTYDEENGLSIYYALFRDDDEKHDKNGFYVTSSTNCKLEDFTVPEEDDNTHGYVDPLTEITLMRISGKRLINTAECKDEYGYVAENSSIRTKYSKFKDRKKYNINTKAYDSIDMYIKDPSAYREDLIIP